MKKDLGTKAQTADSKPRNRTGTIKFLRFLAVATLLGLAVTGSAVQAADALIGHWLSGSTDLTDSSGYTPAGTHDGLVVSNSAALSWSTDVPSGFLGDSLDLSVSGGAILITNTAVYDNNYQTTFDQGIASQFSVACWFKGKIPGDWVSKSGNTPSGWVMRLLKTGSATNADFTMRSTLNFEGISGSLTSSNQLTDTSWHHVAIVFDGTQSYRKVYVDGVLQAQITGTPYLVNYMNLSHLLIGATQANSTNGAISAFWAGKIYDVRMYNYPLTPSYVAALTTPGGLNALKDVLSCTFPTWGAATISGTNITMTVPYGTDLTALQPTFTIDGASISPASGAPVNFSAPQTYTVTAADSSTQTYQVTVTVAPISSANNILTFGPGAYISGTNIVWSLPYGTAVTNLSPTYTASLVATGAPASGSMLDFSTPRTYTVTAQDGTSVQAYQVTAVVQGPAFTYTNKIGLWSASANWTNNAGLGAVAPSAAGDTGYALNFMPSANNSLSTNDLNNGFLVNQLNFFGLNNLTLKGNDLALSDNGAELPAIQQNGYGAAVINNNLDLGDNTIIGGSSYGPITLAGNISGSGGLTKTCIAPLTLSGTNNTFAGGMVINAGNVSVGNTSSNIFGTGPVVMNSQGKLNLSANNLVNDFTFNGGTVVNGNSFGATLKGSVTLAVTTTFDVANNGSLSIPGNISGPGGLTKNGASPLPLYLSGTNTYAGPTTVLAGVLRCDNPYTLGSSALNINSGATVNLNYVGDQSVSNLIIAGVAMPNGNYGSPTNSGADITNAAFLGAGTITVGPHIQALIKSFTFPGQPVPTIDQTNHTITLTALSGTEVTNLAPTYTTSYYASSLPVSGTALDFTTPQTYTVVSGDLTVTNVYTVTVIASSPTPTVNGISGPVAGNFTIAGSTDIAGNIVVMMTTNLTPPIVWTAIQTNAVSGGNFSIQLPQGVDASAFYRLMGQ